MFRRRSECISRDGDLHITGRVYPAGRLNGGAFAVPVHDRPNWITSLQVLDWNVSIRRGNEGAFLQASATTP